MNCEDKRWNSKQSVSIDTYVVDNNMEYPPIQIVEYTQNVEFITDINLKGKLVAMVLSGNPIDAKNIEIYFKTEDLKRILEFIISK